MTTKTIYTLKNNLWKFYPSPGNKKKASKSDKSHWEDLIANPGKWWDHRKEKLDGLINPKFPDFKHKDTELALWIGSAPDWVPAAIEGLQFDVKKRKNGNVTEWTFKHLQLSKLYDFLLLVRLVFAPLSSSRPLLPSLSPLWLPFVVALSAVAASSFPPSPSAVLRSAIAALSSLPPLFGRRCCPLQRRRSLVLPSLSLRPSSPSSSDRPQIHLILHLRCCLGATPTSPLLTFTFSSDLISPASSVTSQHRLLPSAVDFCLIAVASPFAVDFCLSGVIPSFLWQELLLRTVTGIWIPILAPLSFMDF
ncbi:hypothetical protein ACLOJK_036850 [Asimina triloba]